MATNVSLNPSRMTCWVLMALPLTAAFAQQSEPFAATEREISAEAAQLMQSPGYREKAWGAYLSGKYRLQDQSTALVSQLAAWHELAANTLRGDTPEYAAIQATLDALIQLGHPVDPANLMSFQRQWPVEVLILLAQDPPGSREALLTMARTTERDPVGTIWVAAHNLLVESRSAGIAALILSEVNVSHVFRVTLGSRLRPGERSVHGAGAVCFGPWELAPGFPPFNVDELVFLPQTGDVIAAPGMHPVYYHRALPNGLRGGAFVPLDHQEYCLEYLAALSYLSLNTIKQALAPATHIRWTNLTDYRNQVNAAISAQRVCIQLLLEKAAQRRSTRAGRSGCVTTRDSHRAGRPTPGGPGPSEFAARSGTHQVTAWQALSGPAGIVKAWC